MSKTAKPSKPLVPTSNYVSHYDPTKSHHRAWLQAVLDRLTALDPSALAEGSELCDIWKAAVATKAPAVRAQGGEAQGDPPGRGAPVATSAGADVALSIALPLIKEFEGCRLQAYPDPATGHEPFTIGWGCTSYADGRRVQAGDAITQEQADALLRSRLQSDLTVLEGTVPAWESLNANQQAALLSFSYNCGPRWFGVRGFGTLSACLRQAQLAKVPAALMLYVNPGTPAEAGLRRRRKAEGALWSANPGPVAAVATGTGSGAGGSSAGQRLSNPLVGVPRFTQHDSSQLAQRDRSCFSSSCAMLLETLKPGTLSGPNGDDAYLAVVQRLGDTTSAEAQLQALAHFGVIARLEQHADFALIEQQINRGIPVPCGYLHRGPVHAPRGSGHWLVVIGHTPTHLIVHDPWGEPDLVHGTTVSANGMGIRLTRRNFARRWMVQPAGDGTYQYAPGHGWAVVVDRVR